MKIAEFGHKHVFTTEGGIEVVVTELIKRMSKKNQITVYNRWELDKPKQDYPRLENVRMINTPTLSNSKVNAQMSSALETVQCALDNYDVIHIHAEGPCVFIPLLKATGNRVVVTIHGLDWQRAKWGKFASAYIKLGEKMAGRYADRIIVLNEETANYFRDCYGRRTILIPNGVETSPTTKTDLIEPFGLSKGNYILYLGRIVPEKRLDLLVEAYLQAKTDKKLVIAGDVNEATKQLSWYKKASENNNIIFTGFVTGDLKNQLLSNTALFVLPSDIEGMSIALLEALGFGIRVLASDIKENKDLLQEYGSTFKAGNVASLKEKIEELANADFLRSKEQYMYIKDNYGWDTCAKRTQGVLKDVVLNGRK